MNSNKNNKQKQEQRTITITMNTEHQTTQNYTTEETVHYRQVNRVSSNFKLIKHITIPLSLNIMPLSLNIIPLALNIITLSLNIIPLPLNIIPLSLTYGYMGNRKPKEIFGPVGMEQEN
jgi:hypothetical protein